MVKILNSLLLLAASAQAHYRFSKIVVDGVEEAAEWTAVRMTKNYQGNQGVTDVNSADMRCFQARAGTSTATIAAGKTLGFVANAAVTHFGPVQFYMAKVPEGADINTWEAAGNVWFKAGSISAVKAGADWSWPAYSLLPGGAQIYLSCAQVEVTGGGSGTPGPMVSFPGAYRANDPGLLWSYYPVATTYTAPGPAVWTA
ncbi:unnamed protein product [Parascedosporium putredinis]|uniref:lytic cellulose monooxygenase (C4-dehydrogenating) n=1 Tax=Parascedosporium putredinis TaxID=1442378 RepID=A0A9P1H010_9PEZI|nr:unnamed protein product [Parascedosporium putredinis]CAI7993442.1 unnamed protein product [Parascedosporium putredinis]